MEGVFDCINSGNKTTNVPDSHYKIVAESREKYLSVIEAATSWEEMEQQLNEKYGF